VRLKARQTEGWPSGIACIARGKRTTKKAAHACDERFCVRLEARQTEGWPSGLRRTPGKCVCGKPYREFESRLLRHSKIILLIISIAYDFSQPFNLQIDLQV
jgi:hypothetical protein